MFGKRTVEHDPTGSIFEEIQFIRISEHWIKSTRDPGLWGGSSFDGKIFRQYKMRLDDSVFLDFWYRGKPLAESTAAAFVNILQKPHQLAYEELEQLSELLGPIGANISGRLGTDYTHELKSAEVGPLHQTQVLTVQWEHRKHNRHYLSIFINGEVNGECNGRYAHEIHYSAPEERFQSNLEIAVRTVRSIQWKREQLPPMSSAPV